MNPTIKFYTDVLKDIFVGVTEEGELQINLPNGEVKPIKDTKSKKPIALPTNELLRNKPKDYMFFHPLAEHLNRGEPRITQLFRGWIIYHMSSIAQELCHELMEVAVDPDRQRNLTAKQGEFLKFVGKTNDKTVADMRKVIEASGKAPTNRFINITLSKSTDKSLNWLRQANISFPVLDGAEDEAPFGVKGVSKTNARAIRGMLRYVFGSIYESMEDASATSLSIGSSDETAPYFESLLQVIISFGNMYHEMCKLHKKSLSPGLIERAKFSMDWADELSNLSNLRKRIPVLELDDFEEESSRKNVKSPELKPVATNSKPDWALDASAQQQQVQQQQQQAQQYNQPTQQPKQQGGVTAREALEQHNKAMMQQQVVNPYQQQHAHPYSNMPQQHLPGNWAQANNQMMQMQQMQQMHPMNDIQQRMVNATNQAMMSGQPNMNMMHGNMGMNPNMQMGGMGMNPNMGFGQPGFNQPNQWPMGFNNMPNQGNRFM